jgi:16S rRNA (uracil1498-N3)-methyltransferase
MRIPRIYLSVPLYTGTRVTLRETPFHHVVRVLRLKPGAALTLFNGQGGEFRAVLMSVEQRNATVNVEAFVDRETESPLEVLLAQGIAKGERMDYALQKAVELGVNHILPVFTERSVVNLKGERLMRRLHHWRGVVAGACEQSGRNRLPTVLKPMQLCPWLASCGRQGVRLVLDPAAEQGLGNLIRPVDAITLLIGPEGGLSPAEIATSAAAGFTSIRLGPRIMRTETAGIAALAALQVLWGDLR